MKANSNSDNLTTRNFWVNYWQKTKAEVVHDDVFFKKLIHFFPDRPVTFIEIGGFPGTTVTYFKKFHNYDVTLLDFVIVKEILSEVESINGLKKDDIKSIEGDLFELPIQRKFDVVFSAGFIEHFSDTEGVFRKHVEYLNSGGTLFISLPNFKGIAGIAQKLFDRPNYDVHNIDCMEKGIFKKLCEQYNLKINFLDYYGIPHLWLDHPEKVNPLLRKLFYLASATLMKVDKITKGWLLHGRYFSPYIVLIAKNN